MIGCFPASIRDISAIRGQKLQIFPTHEIMKTNAFAFTAALLVAGSPLAAQQPTAQVPQAEQRAPEQNLRVGPASAPMPREGRGEMNQPQPGGWVAQNQPPRPDPLAENFFPP